MTLISREVGDVEVVPLAGGLELLHLVVFGDRRARDGTGDGAGAGGYGLADALVGTELGHVGTGLTNGIGRGPGW